jgi:hypothetical protein
MNSLLKLATETHGGVDHWNHLESLKAHLSVTGVLWHAKGRPDVLKDIRIELPLHEQRLTTHFVGQNKRSVFTPHQVSIEDEQGHIIESRDDPRRAFEGQSFETPWDDLHVAYFNRERNDRHQTLRELRGECSRTISCQPSCSSNCSK